MIANSLIILSSLMGLSRSDCLPLGIYKVVFGTPSRPNTVIRFIRCQWDHYMITLSIVSRAVKNPADFADKVDFDIAGTANSFMAVSLEMEDKAEQWFDDDWGVANHQQRLVRMMFEQESLLEYPKKWVRSRRVD